MKSVFIIWKHKNNVTTLVDIVKTQKRAEEFSADYNAHTLHKDTHYSWSEESINNSLD